MVATEAIRELAIGLCATLLVPLSDALLAIEKTVRSLMLFRCLPLHRPIGPLLEDVVTSHGIASTSGAPPGTFTASEKHLNHVVCTSRDPQPG